MTDRSFGILIELKDRFSQGLRNLSAPIENAKKELKQLEQAGRELKWAEKYQDKLQRLQPSLTAARETQARLAAQIAATENPTKKLTREYEKPNQKLAALEAKEREYTAQLEHSTDALHRAGIDTADLAAARDQLAQHTDHARAKTLGFNSALKSIDVRDTAQQFSGLSAKLLIVKTAMASLSAAAVGLAPHLAAVGGAVGMSMATFAATSHIAKMSKEMDGLAETSGMTTQRLREIQLLSGFSGLDRKVGEVGDIAKSFGAVNDRIMEIGQTGKKNKDFAESLDEIGINVDKLRNKRPDEVLMQISDAIDKTNATAREKEHMFEKIVGKDSSALLPLLKQKSAEFAEARHYIAAVGAIQTEGQVEAMRRTNRELSFFKIGLDGVAIPHRAKT